MKKSYLVLLVAILPGVLIMSGCSGERTARDGDTVLVQYMGTLSDGTVFDSSVGKEPLEFTLGASQVIPGFEQAVLGMKIDESKTVTIPASEAYGPYRDDFVIVVNREELPAGLDPEVGQQLPMTLTNGQTIMVAVIEVSETTITIDANHSLAGKDLTFEITLVEIKE